MKQRRLTISKHKPKRGTFAARFYSVMRKQRWSQVRTAAELGLSHAAVNQVLSHRRAVPKASVLLKLARLTGCDLGWLIDGTPLVGTTPVTAPGKRRRPTGSAFPRHQDNPRITIITP